MRRESILLTSPLRLLLSLSAVLFFANGCGIKFNNTLTQSALDTSPPDIIVQSSVPSRFVLGQATVNDNVQLEKGIIVPAGIATDGTQLMISDANASRVLIYKSIPSQNFATPDVVLGWQNVKSVAPCKNGSTFSSTGLSSPQGIHLDNGKLYVADSGNNRVLIFNSIPKESCTPADLVLGQPHLSTNFVNRGLSAPTSNTLRGPTGVVTIGNKLIVSDTGNNRVLVWNDKNSLTSGASASVVIGQTGFTTATINSPSASDKTMSAPRGLHTDGTQLLIADSGNNRVLIYPTVPTSPGASATYVMGQTSMTVVSAATAQNRMKAPYDVKVIGSRVYVAEFSSSRVLIWNTIPTSSGVNANAVLGQINYTNSSCNQSAGSTSATLLCGPAYLASDGIRLFASDQTNGRVLVWNAVPTNSDTAASLVIGQPSLSPYRSAANTIASSVVSGTEGYHALQTTFILGDQLFVTGANQNRVLAWNSLPNSSTAEPDFVLGQPDFSSYIANNDGSANTVRSASGISVPRAVWTDGTKLAMTDRGNARVLIWNSMPRSSFTPADIVLGQPNFTTGNINYLSMGYRQPEGVMSDGKNLIVADASHSRVYIWNTWPTQINQTPDVVLGQPNKTSSTANNGGLSAKSLSTPVDLLLIQGKLIVVDRGNNRTLIWNSIPTVDSTPADVVLGQPDFTSSRVYGGSEIDLKSFFPTGLATDSKNRLYIFAGAGRILVWNSVPTKNYAPADWMTGTIPTDHPLVAGSSEWTIYSDRSFAVSKDMMYIPDYYGNRLYGLPLYPIGFYTENETNSMTGKLTALTCEGTSHFMVNEGTRPSGSDSGWQECSTEPGAIQFKLADAREGIHILKVWMKKSATEIKSDPILLPLVYNTTAPLPPVVKLESANPSASSSLTLTLGVCDGTHVLVSEAAVVPSASDSGWMGCRLSGTAPYSLQNLTPGAHSLFVWSKDRAGNVSKTPSSVTVTYSP